MGELTMALREVRGGLLQVSGAVGDKFGLTLTEMEFLDLIARLAPVTPGTIAERTGINPATVTGILDRLEKGRWIRRERDGEDRRRVFVSPSAERVKDLGPRYGVMLKKLSDIYEGYNEQELRLLLDFLRKVRQAGEWSVAELRSAR